MIQKNSILCVQDMCGVTTVRCFHVYKQFSSNISSSGLAIKSSIRIYSRYRKKWKGKKSKAIITLTRARYIKPDGTQIFGFFNGCGLLKKRLSIRGKLIKGYNFYNVKKKKFLNSFSCVIACLKICITTSLIRTLILNLTIV